MNEKRTQYEAGKAVELMRRCLQKGTIPFNLRKDMEEFVEEWSDAKAAVKDWTQQDAERENGAFDAWFKERGYPNYPQQYPLTTENAMHAAWQEAAKRAALNPPKEAE